MKWITKIQINLLIISVGLLGVSAFLIHAGQWELSLTPVFHLAYVIKKLVDEEDTNGH